MARRLPPLNALRAFEAAGRRASMSAAADELAVTPAAVSHQIKTLEDYFGVDLFHRSVRSIRLTDRGAALLPYLSEGLDSWVEGCKKLADQNNAAAVHGGFHRQAVTGDHGAFRSIHAFHTSGA